MAVKYKSKYTFVSIQLVSPASGDFLGSLHPNIEEVKTPFPFN